MSSSFTHSPSYGFSLVPFPSSLSLQGPFSEKSPIILLHPGPPLSQRMRGSWDGSERDSNNQKNSLMRVRIGGEAGVQMLTFFHRYHCSNRVLGSHPDRRDAYRDSKKISCPYHSLPGRLGSAQPYLLWLKEGKLSPVVAFVVNSTLL